MGDSLRKVEILVERIDAKMEFISKIDALRAYAAELRATTGDAAMDVQARACADRIDEILGERHE